jgi:hypothetical protein
MELRLEAGPASSGCTEVAAAAFSLFCTDKGDETYNASKGLGGLAGRIGTLKSEVLERGRHALLSRPKGLISCLRLSAVVLLLSPIGNTILVIILSRIDLKNSNSLRLPIIDPVLAITSRTKD